MILSVGNICNLSREHLAVIFIVEEFLDLSRRSNDLSVDLASSLAGVVSRVAVDRRVDLPVQLAHVVGVENCHLISFIGGFSWEVLFVAVFSGVSALEFVESFLHSAGVSASPFFVGDGIHNTLKLRFKISDAKNYF